MACARALVSEGRPVKSICQALGVARSHMMELMTRSSDWVEGRTVRQIDVLADLALAEAVRAMYYCWLCVIGRARRSPA